MVKDEGTEIPVVAKNNVESPRNDLNKSFLTCPGSLGDSSGIMWSCGKVFGEVSGKVGWHPRIEKN